MPHCRDCTWWDGDRNDPTVTFGGCTKIIVPRELSRGTPASDHAFIIAVLDPDGIEKALTYADDADCYIWLSVGPDFGCVQFEAKP